MDIVSPSTCQQEVDASAHTFARGSQAKGYRINNRVHQIKPYPRILEPLRPPCKMIKKGKMGEGDGAPFIF